MNFQSFYLFTHILEYEGPVLVSVYSHSRVRRSSLCSYLLAFSSTKVQSLFCLLTSSSAKVQSLQLFTHILEHEGTVLVSVYSHSRVRRSSPIAAVDSHPRVRRSNPCSCLLTFSSTKVQSLQLFTHILEYEGPVLATVYSHPRVRRSSPCSCLLTSSSTKVQSLQLFTHILEYEGPVLVFISVGPIIPEEGDSDGSVGWEGPHADALQWFPHTGLPLWHGRRYPPVATLPHHLQAVRLPE